MPEAGDMLESPLTESRLPPPVRVGVVGMGDISDVYLRMIERSPMLQLESVAGRTAGRAAAKAADLGVCASDLPSMLADPEVELIVNLTPAAQHDAVNLQVLEAGKHLYSEKPFALSLLAARALEAAAKRAGVLVGGAPDTFFGAAHQAARAALDNAQIGKPVFGAAFVGHPGIEHFHPDPEAFYQPGGEGPLDIGPYHILQWVNLLGPVRRVACAGAMGAAKREIRRGPKAGTSFAVDVPTSYSALLWFDTAHVVLTLSLDVPMADLPKSQLYGTDGAIVLADPNFFGGGVQIVRAGQPAQEIDVPALPFGRDNRTRHGGLPAADYRGVGIVELALAIRGLAEARTCAPLLTHVTEVATAILRGQRECAIITIESSVTRPLRMGEAAWDDILIAATPSPHA